jgi:hypothetical protein
MREMWQQLNTDFVWGAITGGLFVLVVALAVIR